MTETAPILITCDATGKQQETSANADGSPKLPRGWKRLNGQTLSPQAMRAQYVARSMRLPIASVATESQPDDPTAGWKAFWTAIRAAWDDATRYANLCLS